jgi:hypothetical protein
MIEFNIISLNPNELQLLKNYFEEQKHQYIIAQQYIAVLPIIEKIREIDSRLLNFKNLNEIKA